MGFFDSWNEPIFLKESHSQEQQIEQLKALEPFLNEEGKRIIRQDIKCLEYGILGEKNIEFELKNSHMPMYILHDIYLEYEGLSAQIDYLVFTKKLCFVIECKNLFGDLEVTSDGNFIRTMEFLGKVKREGIYSPITQNQRHIDLMRKIKVERRGNKVLKFMAEKFFDGTIRPIVVLANPKTIFKARYATQDIKDQVVRVDQLIRYIKETHAKSKESSLSKDKVCDWAQSYLNLHKEIKKDYTKKYESYMVNKEQTKIVQQNIQNQKVENVQEPQVQLEETELFKRLKEYRWKKSKEEAIKPYYIYNDAQLKDLITKMPKNEMELQAVSGFGAIKAKKYGADIIEILNQFRDRR